MNSLARLRAFIFIAPVMTSGALVGCANPTMMDGAQALSSGPNIDRWKELMVVDESVVTDARALNNRADGSAGPWSFRHLIEQMVAGTGEDPNDFVERFFLRFHDTSVNEFPECNRAGVDQFLTVWKNGAPRVDLARAPYRLLALANREDITFNGSPGEFRFVFGVNGFGRERMTIIFEYKLPASRSRAQWARRFHELGAQPLGEGLNRLLEEITEEIASRRTTPDENCPVNGNCISQVRANERLFSNEDGELCNFLNWELREFQLKEDGERVSLVPVTVKQTPHFSKNGQDDLAQLLIDNRSAVLNHTFVFPETPASQGGFLGGAAIQGFIRGEHFEWGFTQVGVDPSLSEAFKNDTCNGCHHMRKDVLNGFYHIEPGSIVHSELVGDGQDRVSGFVKNVDMPVRICFMKELLQPGSCASGPRPLAARIH